MKGAGIVILVGNVVWVSLRRPEDDPLRARCRRSAAVTASTISPTTMLSVFEYSYFESGLEDERVLARPSR